MAERLPTVGGDTNVWGTVLNGFLGVAHAADGFLKDPVLVSQYISHTGDLDTRIVFNNNQIILEAGGTGPLTVNTSAVAVAGTLSVSSDFSINTNKFNVTAASGNTTVAGTLIVTGATRINNNLGINTDPSVELHVKDNSSHAAIRVEGAAASNSFIQFMTNGAQTGQITGVNGGTVTFEAASTTMLNLTTSGIMIASGGGTPSSLLHLQGATNTAARIENTGSDAVELILDADRSGTNGNIALIRGYWNGNDVARIAFISGDDATNKDEGYITLWTAPAGGGVVERIRIDKNGQTGFGVTPETDWRSDASALTAVQIGGTSSYAASTTAAAGNVLGIWQNSRQTDGGTQKAIVADEASAIVMFAGKTKIQTAASVAADATQIFVDTLLADENGRIGLKGVASPEGILSFDAAHANNPQIVFQNGSGNTADAAITTYDDANGTYLNLGSNFYINSSGVTTLFNTGEQHSGVQFQSGGSTLFYNGTGVSINESMRITGSGWVGIGHAPVGVFSIRVAADDVLRVSQQTDLSLAGVNDAASAFVAMRLDGNPLILNAQSGDNIAIGTDSAPELLTIEEQSSGATSIFQFLKQSGVDTGFKIGIDSAVTGDFFILSRASGVDSNKLVSINKTGNVGIGQSNIESWETGASGYKAIQLGQRASWYASEQSGGNTIFASNVYHKATGGDSYIFNGPVTSYVQNINGDHQFLVAAAGAVDSSISWTTALHIENNGRIGIGTVTPETDVQLAKAGQPQFRINSYSTIEALGPVLQFVKSNSDTLGTLSTTNNTDTLMSIGIFGCVGASEAQGASITAKQDGAVGTKAPTNIIFETSSSTATNTNQLVLHNDGRIGVGTDAPGTTLEVRGSDNSNVAYFTGLTGTNTRGLRIALAGAGATNQVVILDSQQASGIIEFQTAGTKRAQIDSTGILGQNLIGGAINVTADASGYLVRDPSDEKFKHNIRDIHRALDTVLLLRGREFTWNDDTDMGEGDDLGLIAQEVCFVDNRLATVGGEYMSIRQNGLIALLIEAVKEQQREIDTLKGLLQ